MELETSSQILLATGILMLVAGFVTGAMMGQIRKTEPTVPKYLTMAHLAGYQQAPILFGLIIATEVSDLSAGVENTGAAIFAISALLLFVKEMVNHLQGTADEFAENSTGYKIALVFGPLHLVGLVIIGFGALTGM